MPLITEQRQYFLATQQQALNDKNHEMNVSIFSKHSGFLYSVHVRAHGAPTAGLQNLRASPLVSIFGPSDTVTTGNLRDTGSVCLSTVEPKSLTGLRRVTLYRII